MVLFHRTLLSRWARFPHSVKQQYRFLAVPVNPSSSVDPLLGTSIPPAPVEGVDVDKMANSRSTNLNHLSKLLNPRTYAQSRFDVEPEDDDPFGSSIHAALQMLKGAAVGAQRQGTPIPSRDEMLEELFNQSLFQKPKPNVVVDREHPHPIDATNHLNELDQRILAAARALNAASNLPTPSLSMSKSLSVSRDIFKAASIADLLQSFDQRAGFQLSIQLPYESTPSKERRVPLTSAISTQEELEQAKEDGVLMIAFVSNLNAGRGKERISVCSGFAVEGGDKIPADEGDGKGSLVVTCAHTLQSYQSSLQKSTEAGDHDLPASIALAITRTGAIYPIRNLISSLAASDMVLLQLGERPLSLNGKPENNQHRIRTLPVSPYPACVNSELSVSSFWGWEDDLCSILPAYIFDAKHHRRNLSGPPPPPPPPAGGDKEKVKLERDNAGKSRWGRVRLVEYRDPCGGQAIVGTYDELAQLDFKLLISSSANLPALQGEPALGISATVESSTTFSKSTGASGGNSSRQPLANFPPSGSSGGPVVDVETGSVVGVVRGHKMSPLEGRRGDAIPAEKVFEFFALPGLGKKF